MVPIYSSKSRKVDKDHFSLKTVKAASINDTRMYHSSFGPWTKSQAGLVTLPGTMVLPWFQARLPTCQSYVCIARVDTYDKIEISIIGAGVYSSTWHKPGILPTIVLLGMCYDLMLSKPCLTSLERC